MIKENRYTSAGNKSGIQILKDIFSELPHAHALGYSLATRNIKAKYRQSLLGILWAVFPTLATSFVWIVLRGQGVISFEETEVPYAVFVLTGTFLWQAFSVSATTFLQTIQTNRSILVKINFPRESLLYSAFYEILFNILLSFIPVLAVLVVFKILPGSGILFFLLLLFMLMILGLALGLLLLPFASLFKDIMFGLPVALQFGMYLTPVIYPEPVYSGFATVLKFNPVTPLLTGARAGLLGTSGIPALDTILMYIFGLILLFLLGTLLMRVTMEILIERMGT
jgi:lipopolysaccharide transport system permease protein